MRTYHIKAEVLARDVDVFLGMDVSAASIALAVLGPDRALLLRRKVPYTEEAVLAVLAQFPRCRIKAVYEAGPTGYTLLGWLKKAGCQAFITPPSLVPVASGDVVKTDKKDALKLATLLAAGQLRACRELTPEAYADRQLVRSRRRAVNARSDVMREIRSLLLMHGLTPPEELGDTWSKRLVTWLLELDCGHPSLTVALREEVHRWQQADEAVRRLDGAVRALADKPNYAARVALLRSVPGIGELSALEVVTEIQDVKAFENASALASFLGLTPCEYSTGKSQGRRGHISRKGNPHLRTTLTEAAWRLVAKDPVVKKRYQDLAQRAGSKKAVVAIARRLATIIFAMLRDGAPYSANRDKMTIQPPHKHAA